MSSTSTEAYLDWAASTPMRPTVVEAMVEATQWFGNPTGAHRKAREAMRAVDDAREIVADALGAQPAEVIFCGSGTEADNLAIFGALNRTDATVPVCSAIEHHAVLHPVEHLGGRVIGVDDLGQLDLDDLAGSLGPEVAVVSVMTANNETGVIQPLDDVVECVKERAPNALVHTDAVQAFPWIDVAAATPHVDLISISGHKFGGPKGVGAMVVRRGSGLHSQILGGGQEFDLRSGTHNVAGIVALGAAAAAMVDERAAVNDRVGALRDRLADELRRKVPDTTETGVTETADGTDRSLKVAGSCHLCFADIESEALLFLIEREGVFASAASSCASGAQDPSHVLAAMGYSRELAGGSLRLSLGYGSTDADVDHALAVIPAAIDQLRSHRG